jgi:hypothetical protein
VGVFATALPAQFVGLVALAASTHGLTGILPERWFLFVAILLAPALGLSLIVVAALPRVGAPLVAAAVMCLVGLNVGSYLANATGTGITTTKVQRAGFSEAELQAASAIQSHLQHTAATDRFYLTLFAPDKLSDGSGFLVRHTPLQGYFVLRDAVKSEPIWVTNAQGAVGSALLDPSSLHAALLPLFTLYDNGAVQLLRAGSAGGNDG